MTRTSATRSQTFGRNACPSLGVRISSSVMRAAFVLSWFDWPDLPALRRVTRRSVIGRFYDGFIVARRPDRAPDFRNCKSPRFDELFQQGPDAPACRRNGRLQAEAADDLFEYCVVLDRRGEQGVDLDTSAFREVGAVELP